MLPALVAFACIGAYASQLFLGRWQNDEYHLFAIERQWGWHALLPRLAYSPRPFSEAVLFLYGKAVLSLHRPLITSFLGLLWALILAASTVAAAVALPRAPTRPLVAAGLVSSLVAFVLVTDNPTEVFFWPMAAAAYLPTCSGAVALCFLLSPSASRARRLGCAVVLIIVAASSEVGAALAVSFAAAALVEMWTERRPVRLGAALWWLLPGLLGIIVFAALLRLRAGMNELGAAAHPATGHLRLALLLGARQLISEFFGVANASNDVGAAGVFATKLLFAFSFALVFRQVGGVRPGRLHIALAVSFMAAAFFSLFTSYFHYGTSCCERQATTRSWLFDLVLILAAGVLVPEWITQNLLRARWIGGLASLLLTISLYPALPHVAGLREGYAARGLAFEARSRTWKSGLQTDTSTMKFYLPPDGNHLLVRGTAEKLGSYHVGVDSSEIITAVGDFFDKAVVIVCEPWQTEKSLLLDGDFIPACPPHGGPPDIVGSYRR